MSDIFPDDSFPDEYTHEDDSSYTTHIAARRFYVLLEVFMLMLLNFLIIIGLQFLILPLIPIPEANPYRGLIEYTANLISVVVATILSLVFVQLVFYKNKLPIKDAEPPLKETKSLFTFNKFGLQIVFTFLLLFLVYIPLDLLTYSLPGGLDFSERSLESSGPVNAYLNFSQWGMFLLYSLILHLMVGLREEVFFRGYFTIRAEKYLNSGSAVIITSIYFGMSHFTYLINSENVILDLLPAFVWSLGAFYVGSISAVFLINKRWIWPIILAHTLNNIISSTALWLYSTHGITLWNLAKFMYFPLLGVAILLGLIFFREVKTGVQAYFNTFKSFKTTFPERSMRVKIIIVDIIFGVVFWAIGMTFI